MSIKFKVKALLCFLMVGGLVCGISDCSGVYGMKRTAAGRKLSVVIPPPEPVIDDADMRILNMFMDSRQIALHKEWFELLDKGDTSELYKFLSQHGRESVNWQSEKGISSLNYAVSKSTVEIVEFLLENDADVNARDMSGRNPLLCAVLRIADVKDSVFRHDPKDNELLLRQAQDVLSSLLNYEPNLNAVFDDRSTVLHFVAARGLWGLYARLLTFGANENIENYEGETPRDIYNYGKLCDPKRMKLDAC